MEAVVAFEIVQFSVDELPDVMVVGFAKKVMPGGGLVLPPQEVEKVNVTEAVVLLVIPGAMAMAVTTTLGRLLLIVKGPL